tara:strand:+ start:260 stop:778 length:519 start_codon:yes stop_codon:yes gene_type:complete
MIGDNVIEEQVEIFLESHPMGESLRRIILDESKTIDYNMSYKTNVQASMSSWTEDTPGIKMIEEWIFNDPLGAYLNKGFKLVMNNAWFAKYSKGEYTKTHMHIPAVFSFVYFVQSPPGSSPLVFTYSKKEIEPEEGKLVMFPSMVYHHVPPNKCDDRIVLAGNISAVPKEWK